MTSDTLGITRIMIEINFGSNVSKVYYYGEHSIFTGALVKINLNAEKDI